jgi:mannose-6-phosphate isomerase
LTTYGEERERFLAWVRDEALPFWADRSRDDENGGYYEALTHTGEPVTDAPKRWRVQARQAFSFARAERLGLMKDARAASDHAWRFMIDAGLKPEQDFVRSFVHLLGPQGQILGNKRDSYDHAFALLASAERHIAYGDKETDGIDHVVQGFFGALEHSAGGYAEGFPSSLPRRQNPHMHLFEAALLRLEAGPSGFAEHAKNEVRKLYDAHFWDRDIGVLREFFEDEWALPSDKGSIIEPGHMVEWLWLLDRAESAAPDHLTLLYDRALEIGPLGGTGLLADQVDLRSGEVARTGRLWCQTELIRAAATLGRITGQEHYYEQAARYLATFTSFYLAPVAKGGWVDRIDQNGAPVSDLMPTSLLYHIITLADELHRNEGP